MAYAFSAIDELLKGQQGGEPVQGSNIFAAESPTQVGAQTQDGGEGSMEAETGTKTVAEGGTGTGTKATTPEATGGTESQAATAKTVADKAAVQANIGKTAEPAALGGIKQQLEANQQRLQKEAEDYMKTEQGRQTYAYDQPTVQRAISGQDQGAFDYIGQLLGTQSAKPVKEFKASDVGVRDVDYLGTEAGLKQLLARGKDPRYTGGMAAFDLRALQKTPGFGQTVRDIQGEQERLQQAVGTTAQDVESRAGLYGEQQLAGAKESVQGLLRAAQNALVQGNIDEAAMYNQQLQGLDVGAIGGEAAAQAAENLRQRISGVDPYVSGFIDPALVDPRAYLSRGQELGAERFVSADEAAQFNRIMSLLGEGGQAWSESLPVTDAATNFAIDRAALENQLLQEAQGRYGAYETQTQGQIEAIRQAAQARADAEDARRAAVLAGQEAPEWARSEAQRAIEEAGIQGADVGYLDPTQYMGTTPDLGDLGAADVMTAAEAEEINRLGRTIRGGPTGEVAGGYSLADPNRFDRERFLEDMRRVVNERAALAQGVPGFETMAGGGTGGGGAGGLPSAQDFLVSAAEQLPGGKGVTGAVRQAYDMISPVTDFYRRQYTPQIGRGGFSSMGVPRGIAEPIQSAANKATETYLRQRLMAANQALEADGGIVERAVGDVVSGAKQLGGQLAAGAKQLGGDIASGVKETIRNPFNRLRRW